MDNYGYTLLLPPIACGVINRKIAVKVNDHESIYDINLQEISPEFILADGAVVSMVLYDYTENDVIINNIDFIVSDKISASISDKISIIAIRLI